MKKTVALSLLFASAFSLSAAELKLHAVTDRPDALYKTGEPATFTITATEDDKPLTEGTISVILSKDGLYPQPPQTLSLKDGKATLTSQLDEPGFLLLEAFKNKAGAAASAGYDPLELKPSMPVPEDFDAFWNTQKAKLAKVPLNAKLTPVLNNEGINKANAELFDVQVDCVGAPVSGYYVRPKGAAKGSLPAIITLHGAGVNSAGVQTNWVNKEGGMLSMNINAHGIPNGQPKEFYENLKNGDLRNYNTRGRSDREQVYFLGMFLRVARAIDFMASQPEWDGKTIILYGSSQGGFQAFAGAALDSRVTFFCAGVPAGSDHTGFAANRIAGWPKLVALTPDAKHDYASTEAARYFDNVNFAIHTKAKGAAVTVGFIDKTCPPSTVYAAYNALSIPKTMHIDTLAGHTNTPAAVQFMEAAALKHVREMKSNAKTAVK